MNHVGDHDVLRDALALARRAGEAANGEAPLKA
jgi:hypothetical protein